MFWFVSQIQTLDTEAVRLFHWAMYQLTTAAFRRLRHASANNTAYRAAAKLFLNNSISQVSGRSVVRSWPTAKKKKQPHKNHSYTYVRTHYVTRSNKLLTGKQCPVSLVLTNALRLCVCFAAQSTPSSGHVSWPERGIATAR